MDINIIDSEGNIFDTVTVPDLDEISIDMRSDDSELNGLLDPSFCRGLREAINSSPIFAYDDNYRAQYNLCCAVMDRLDTCIEKLNSYGDYPESEEDFLAFMMFASMAEDAVKEVLQQLQIHKKRNRIYNTEEDYKYFSEAYLNSPIYNSQKDMPTDDEFFAYFRSLSFAHPADTSRAKFIANGETQYSPWVIVNRSAMRLSGYEDGVGVRIYTSLKDEILDLKLSFSTLKDYIKSRYERIALATKWVVEQIESKKIEWRKRKVNRNQPVIDVLREIAEILDTRFERKSSIDEIIRYMECDLSNETNMEAVNLYRTAISDAVPSICDAVDNLDQESVEAICDTFFKRPRRMHQMASYQLEKIFCYLGENASPNTKSDVLFGLNQAKYFSEGFASKWVSIDIKQMSHTEIQLLTRVACFMEKNWQEKSDENH